mmetsp:Transcript_124426/g.220450  ORF Transcript_124426/g.220450 Transcript_124426/m.220450 type:complete len:281 (+) Transcript_124426:273-1115(+)
MCTAELSRFVDLCFNDLTNSQLQHFILQASVDKDWALPTQFQSHWCQCLCTAGSHSLRSLSTTSEDQVVGAFINQPLNSFPAAFLHPDQAGEILVTKPSKHSGHSGNQFCWLDGHSVSSSQHACHRNQCQCHWRIPWHDYSAHTLWLVYHFPVSFHPIFQHIRTCVPERLWCHPLGNQFLVISDCSKDHFRCAIEAMGHNPVLFLRIANQVQIFRYHLECLLQGLHALLRGCQRLPVRSEPGDGQRALRGRSSQISVAGSDNQSLALMNVHGHFDSGCRS